MLYFEDLSMPNWCILFNDNLTIQCFAPADPNNREMRIVVSLTYTDSWIENEIFTQFNLKIRNNVP